MKRARHDEADVTVVPRDNAEAGEDDEADVTGVAAGVEVEAKVIIAEGAVTGGVGCFARLTELGQLTRPMPLLQLVLSWPSC